MASRLPGQASPPGARLAPFVGLHLFSADVAAIYGGLAQRPGWDSDVVPSWSPSASGEIGLAGGALSLGVARHLRPAPDVAGIGSEIVLQLRATYLRTWGNPFHVASDQSFAGAELQLTAVVLGARLGVFRRIAGNAPGDAHLLTIGFVIGWY